MVNMNSRFTYVAIGALVVAVLGLGYLYYQDQKNSADIEITVDDNGISLDAD